MVTQSKATNLAKKVLKKNFSRIDRGLNNWVFEKKGLILTIPRHERVKDYSIRVAATRKLEQEGIPVAKIVEYSPESSNTPEYLIIEKVEGENADLSRKTTVQRDKIHRSTGEVLSAIHSIRTEGYGRLDERLEGSYNSWNGFLDFFFEDSFKRLERDDKLLKEYGCRLRTEYLESRMKAQELKDGFFLHADYHPGNVLYKNDLVIAVLDLDLVTSGDPNWDTGHYSHTFNVDRAGGLDSFRKGYNMDIDPIAEKLYSISIWTRKIGSQVIDRPEALNESILELNKILEER